MLTKYINILGEFYLLTIINQYLVACVFCAAAFADLDLSRITWSVFTLVLFGSI